MCDHVSRFIVHNNYNNFFFVHLLHVMHAYIKGPEERIAGTICKQNYHECDH